MRTTVFVLAFLRSLSGLCFLSPSSFYALVLVLALVRPWLCYWFCLVLIVCLVGVWFWFRLGHALGFRARHGLGVRIEYGLGFRVGHWLGFRVEHGLG